MNEPDRNQGLLTVILCSYNSGVRIHTVYQHLAGLLIAEKIPWELLIMDDGSTDNSFQLAAELEKQDHRVRSYQLSRNYTSTYSIFAGLSVSNGSCATAIPDDEQLPYRDIVRMYRNWQEGNKSVFLYRESRKDKWHGKLYSHLFYLLMNRFSSFQYPKGGTDTFLIDRELIDILNRRIHPVNTSIITEIFRLGFDPVYLPYDRPLSKVSKSRWTFRKRMKYGLDIFFSSSAFPIKFIFAMGLMFSLVSFLLIVFYSYIKIFGDKNFWGTYPSGWTSIILFISFFSGLILLSLGIIAEYIWRIHEEVKDRPGFIIKKKML